MRGRSEAQQAPSRRHALRDLLADVDRHQQRAERSVGGGLHPDRARLGDDHPSTRGLPAEWVRRDEWYNFREDPSPGVTALILLDETSYTGGTMSTRHPAAWCHEYDGGRAWYTALGHTVETYAEPLFLAHVLGGIQWAADMPQD